MRTLKIMATILVAASAVGAAARASAATVVLPASHDATIFQNNPDNGSGAGNGLFAGTNGSKSPRRALISFNFSSIPQGSTIQSAKLVLTLGQIAGSGGGGASGPATSTIDLHLLTAPWGEGLTLRQTPPSDTFGQMGQGDAAANGDVTWNDRFFGAAPPAPWTAAGGDYSSTVSSTLTVGTTLNVPYEWSTTAATVSDVQSWLNNPSTNYGWILVNQDETTATNFRAFYTRETATTAYHPALSVTYAAATLTADFDVDHDVDGTDFLLWQRGLGIAMGATGLQGDANGDGAVTTTDLTAWRQQFGMTSPAMSVPEPGGVALAGLVCALTFRWHRRRDARGGKAIRSGA